MNRLVIAAIVAACSTAVTAQDGTQKGAEIMAQVRAGARRRQARATQDAEPRRAVRSRDGAAAGQGHDGVDDAVAGSHASQ